MTGPDIKGLESQGCVLAAGACRQPALRELQSLFDRDQLPGKRLPVGAPIVRTALAEIMPVLETIGSELRAVRAVCFDKSAARNWVVPWHQDRTIAVRARANIDGFGPWSVKGGAIHVEPPFSLLAEMITVRIHLDDCPANNAPLIVALGSHRTLVPADKAEVQAAALPVLSCHAVAGDLWIYATPILHRSGRATVPSRRRVLQIDFSAAELPEPLAWAA